jgi:PAS domain S-box-containing protein
VGVFVPAAAQAAFELVDDGVVVATADDGERVLYVNAAFERASKYRRHDVVGRAIGSLGEPRPLASEPDLCVMTRADGEEYVVRKKRAFLEGVADAPLLLETHRDVTAERAVRESEALYRMLAERSSDIISRTDATGRCIYISASCRDVLGYDPEEIVGRHALVDLAHPDDRAQQQGVLTRFVQQGLTSGSPLRRRLRRKDGTYVWLETCTNIEREGSGRIVEVQSWARDITARVHAEQALARSEERFRSLLDGLPDGVAVHRDGTMLYANAELARMTGHERTEDLVGRSLLEFVHPDERDSIRDILRDGQRTGARAKERRIVRRDGAVRTFGITSLPLLFEGELAFLAICHDLTEHKSMEERLALAERLALVGRLASGVGHEINNPLAYMLGSLELARADLTALAAHTGASDGVARVQERLVTLREGAERVRDIVRDLKALSAVGGDRMAAVDLERALDVAAATAHHEIRQRARLVKDYRSVPPVWANEGRLTQVFVNLLVNAAQAIPEGDANDNEIRITAFDEGELAVVEVRDTGIGIAAEDLPHIFEPFFTTKQKGVGTGLGLSISHSLMAAQGGTLVAERLSPRGALFRVTLRTSTEALTQATSPGSRELEAPRARVLLVDDEPRMARVLADLLSNHDVTIAHSGREAIACLVESAAFDVIVCDLQMTDGNGADVYDYLCLHAPELARRALSTTGGAFTKGAREFLARCPQPVLEKPFDEARFTILVDELAKRASAKSG